MKTVFADANYWVALLNPKEQLYHRAKAVQSKLRQAQLLTTEFVLAEFLNFYAPRGESLRLAASELVTRILQNSRIDVIASDREIFTAALTLYARRQDQQYSLTDCISMVVMKRRAVAEVLTQDRHFRQEGFVPLLERSR